MEKENYSKMQYEIDNKIYNIIIEKKNNKNTYIRVKEDMTILITTSYFTSKKQINEILDNNIDYVRKMLSRRIEQNIKDQDFYFLGNKYDIIIVPTLKNIEIDNFKIYTPSIEKLNKWLQKQMLFIFEERLKQNYNLFEENIPFPKLKTRNMKTRWGVCNRKNLTVTLNSKLIKMDIKYTDYVIIHELAHLVHFDHSRNFWNCVEKYFPNYKIVRKELKD